MSQLQKVYAPTDSPSGTIIFVHGLGGNAIQTWRATTDEDASWPAWLGEDIPGLTVFSLDYPAAVSNWIGSAMPLQDRAGNVLEGLLVDLEKLPPPIVFVCHSLGGLVVKQLLRKANDLRDARPEAATLIERVRGVVFIATPHNGSALADALALFKTLLRVSSAAQDLIKNDPALRDLNTWYRDWSVRHAIQHRVFFETIARAGVTTVDAGSADPGLLNAQPIAIDADHIQICKPADRDVLLYKSTRSFITKLIPQVPRASTAGTTDKSAPFAPSQSYNTETANRLVDDLSKTAVASKFSGKVQAFFEEYLITETATETRAAPFGGRDEELQLLDSWLADEQAPARFVVAAPAGRGKSALLVHWLERRNALAAHEDQSWHIAFVPISIRFSTNLPTIFYEAIAAKLGEILGQEVKPPSPGTDSAAHYEDQCRRLLDRSISQKIKTLVVVDGIDEALGGRFSADWFPRAPGSCVRILLSARLQIGDGDAYGWVARLGWGARVRVRTHDLSALTYEGVADLLRRVGAPIDVLAAKPAIIHRLSALSGGEPLLLRLYVEDLWQNADAADRLKPEDLDRIQPGFKGFFEDWIRRQREAWNLESSELGEPIDEGTVFAYLIVLACAYGPLTAQEVTGIARRLHPIPMTFRIENALFPLRRFIVGTGRDSDKPARGYVLSHPKFGEFLRNEYFDSEGVEQTRRAIADWGRHIVRQLKDGELASDKAPSYLLQYLGQHYEDTNAPTGDFLACVNEGWLRAWASFEGGYRGFSRDVRRAIHAAAHQASEGKPFGAQQLRCQLVLISIASAGSGLPAELIARCVKHGILPPRQALTLLEYHQDYERSRCLVMLAPHLSNTMRIEALASAKAIGQCQYRASALAGLAANLPEPDRNQVLADALEVARSEEALRPFALAGLVPFLPNATRARVLAEIRTLAPSLKDSDRAELLLRVALHFPEAERRDAAVEAVSAIRATKYEYTYVRGLGTLVPLLPGTQRAEVVGEALQAIQRYTSAVERNIALADLVPVLSETQLTKITRNAISEIGIIESTGFLLARLAPRLPPTLHVEVLHAAQALRTGEEKARVLVGLAPYLPDPQRSKVVAETLEAVQDAEAGTVPLLLVDLSSAVPAGQRIELFNKAMKALAHKAPYPFGRIATLQKLADVLPETMLGKALQSAQVIGDAAARALALAELAVALPEAERTKLLPEALCVAKTVIGDNDRASTLLELSRYLDPGERARLLSDMLRLGRHVTNLETKAFILTRVARQLPEADQANVLDEAYAAMRAMAQGPNRTLALAALIPLQPRANHNSLLTELAAGDEATSAELLANLIPQLGAEDAAYALDRAMNIARTHNRDYCRALTLAALAPHLPPASHREALVIARAIVSAGWRAQALAAIGAQLTEPDRTTVLGEALTTAHGITEVGSRDAALVKIVACVAMAPALQIAGSMISDHRRAQAFSELVLTMPDSFTEILNSFVLCIQGINRDRYLKMLKNFLPTIARREGPDGIRVILAAVQDTAKWFP